MPETIETKQTDASNTTTTATNGEGYVTPGEAARRLGVQARTIRGQLASGTLRGVKIGRVWRVQWPPQNS